MSNNTTKKSIAVIVQLKLANNNVLKKDLIDSLMRNQLDSSIKTFTDN